MSGSLTFAAVQRDCSSAGVSQLFFSFSLRLLQAQRHHLLPWNHLHRHLSSSPQLHTFLSCCTSRRHLPRHLGQESRRINGCHDSCHLRHRFAIRRQDVPLTFVSEIFQGLISLSYVILRHHFTFISYSQADAKHENLCKPSASLRCVYLGARTFLKGAYLCARTLGANFSSR